MTLDVRSMVMLAALISALVFACLLAVAPNYGETVRRAAWHWTIGVGVQAVGWLLFAIRGHLDSNVAIVLTNTLLAAGYAEWVRALRVFGGRSPASLPLASVVVGVALVAIVFAYAYPSLTGRVIGISVLLLALTGAGLHAVLRLAPIARPSSHRIMLATYLLGAGVLLIRLIAQLVNPVPSDDPYLMHPVAAMVFATGAMFPVIASFAFVLMAGDRLNAELARLAAFDPLTGAYNRRSLGELAARSIAEARRHVRSVAVLVVDADHFKRINDSFGHATGDDVLKALVATMRATLRAEDLLGRLGGEEFVVVMPEADEADAVRGAERLRAAIEARPFRAHGTDVPLRVSVGVAALVHAGDDFGTLVRRADQALYEAKRRGRNRVVAASEMLMPV